MLRLTENKSLSLTNEEEQEHLLHPDTIVIVRFNKFLKSIGQFFKILGQSISNFLSIGFKISDLMDDLWAGLSRTNPFLFNLTPIVTGIFAFIGHCFIAFNSACKAVKAYYKETTLNRTAKIIVQSAAFLLSMGGAGVASTYFASYFAAGLLGIAYMPVVSCAVMTTVFVFQFGLQVADKIVIRKRLNEIKQEIAEIDAKINKSNEYLDKLDKAYTHTHHDPKDNTEANRELNKEILTQIENQQKSREELLARKQELLKEKEPLKEKNTSLNRKMIFKGIENVASALVLVGVILGTSAIIGGGIASMGALPLVILFTGVAIGISLKIFEYVDKESNQFYSNWIKKNVFGMQPKKLKVPEDVVKPSHQPSPASSVSVLRALSEPSQPINVPTHKPKDFDNHPESLAFSNTTLSAQPDDLSYNPKDTRPKWQSTDKYYSYLSLHKTWRYNSLHENKTISYHLSHCGNVL